MAKQKDWRSTSLLKTTKFITNAHQSSTKWTGNLQKDILFQKTKKRPHQDVGGVITRYKQPHTSRVGKTTDWKLTASQRLTYRSESSETRIKFPCVGIWHWEKEPPGHLALKASRNSMGLGEMETSFLKGAHRLQCVLGPREKQSFHRNLGQT